MSFAVIDPAATTVKLQTAVLLYGTNGGMSTAKYATVHPVTCTEGGQPVIREGQPADRKALLAFAQSLMDSCAIPSGVLSPNIMSVGPDHVVWYAPPSRETYFFNTRPVAEGAVSVGTRAGEAFSPGMIFAVRDKTMWVFAVKGKTRPDEDTPLYHCPLMNVYIDGKVCTGSMPLPKSTMVASIKEWQMSFWSSAFSHPNMMKAVNYKGGLHAFSVDLLDGKFKKFPERYLRRIPNLTLGTFVSRIESRKEC